MEALFGLYWGTIWVPIRPYLGSMCALFCALFGLYLVPMVLS